MPTVRTRFAPSPTGYLHLGGARTALFAWAWARQQGGEFMLRIEDTDAVRSSREHSEAIINALDWLGLDVDQSPYFQSARRAQHVNLAEQLVAAGHAYHCYCSPDELAAMRDEQLRRGESPRYDRRWRDSKQPPPAGVPPAIRLRMPLAGETKYTDAVKGEMCIDTAELDDLVLLRADGMPTYNFANVADDADEGMTHVIRGDDHVMNTFRQIHIYAALDKTPPIFAHLPMILCAAKDDTGAPLLGADGAVRYERMSKRHAAVDVMDYEEQGFVAAAMINYLARLSWSCGDVEFFDRDFLVKHFSFATVQHSPARFDMEKLRWLNREHLRAMSPAEVRAIAGLPKTLSDDALALVLPRVESLNDLPEDVVYYIKTPKLERKLLAVLSPDPMYLPTIWRKFNKDVPIIDNALLATYCHDDKLLAKLHNDLQDIPVNEWRTEDIKRVIKETAVDRGVKFPQVGMPLRVLLTGRTKSPDIASVAAVLGRESTLARLVAYYINPPPIDDKWQAESEVEKTEDALATYCYDDKLLELLHIHLQNLPTDKWDAKSIKESIKETADEHGVKFTEVEMSLRVLLTGRINSPDIAAVAVALGRKKTLESLIKEPKGPWWIKIIRKHTYPDPPGGIIF